jgi:hypothetical protein
MGVCSPEGCFMDSSVWNGDAWYFFSVGCVEPVPYESLLIKQKSFWIESFDRF